jgi:hypothetical protein
MKRRAAIGARRQWPGRRHSKIIVEARANARNSSGSLSITRKYQHLNARNLLAASKSSVIASALGVK